MWDELKSEWFGSDDHNDEKPDVAPIMNSKFHDQKPTQITTLSDDEIAFKSKGIRLRQVAQSYMRQMAPKTPETAMTIRALSTKLSIPPGWLTDLINVTEGVSRTDDNRYYMPPLPGSILTTGAPVVLSERSEHHPIIP